MSTSELDPKALGSIRKQQTKIKGHEYTRWVVDMGYRNGKRQRKSFSSEQAARKHLKKYRENRGEIGKKAAMLDAAKLDDAVTAIDRLNGATSLTQAAEFYDRYHDAVPMDDAIAALGELKGGATLHRAAQFYMKHVGSASQRLTVGQTVAEYIEDSKKRNLRPTSMQDLELRLGRFRKAFEGVLLTDVTRREASRWLGDLKTRGGTPLAPLSQKHYKVVCGGFFNWAIDHEYLAMNPFEKRSRGRRKTEGMKDQTMPEVLTPAQVKKVMLEAAKYECKTRTEGISSMVPALALGFFAGIRTQEIKRLDWQYIDLKAKRITIPSAIAKKRSVRHIEMQPNLVKWLRPHHRDQGPVVPEGKAWRYHLDNVREHAPEVPWPHNCMRHSFATYHLAMFGDARLTEMQLGHRSDDLLYTHYRALDTKEDAEKYWKIVPENIV